MFSEKPPSHGSPRDTKHVLGSAPRGLVRCRPRAKVMNSPHGMARIPELPTRGGSARKGRAWARTRQRQAGGRQRPAAATYPSRRSRESSSRGPRRLTFSSSSVLDLVTVLTLPRPAPPNHHRPAAPARPATPGSSHLPTPLPHLPPHKFISPWLTGPRRLQLRQCSQITRRKT